MSSPSFCLLPWVSVAIRNNGSYRVCCNANTSSGQGLLKDSLGKALNAGESGIQEVRNAETLKEIRKEMLAGKWPASCSRCAREEEAGIRSKRLFSADALPKSLDFEWANSITEKDGFLPLEKSPLLDLDIRFGNKCNLACRMCGPSDSSLWAVDHLKLGGIPKKETFDWYENTPFWHSLDAQGHKIQHVYIVGGEPLLIERHYEFLQALVSQGRAQEIILEYNTNLTYLPERALHLWEHFRKVRVGISFDGLGAVNDYIRYPSHFAALEKNLDRLDEAEGNIQAWLACTVSIYNLHHLVDIMRWIFQRGFQRIGTGAGKEFFVPHPVHKPEHLNVQALNLETKRIYEEYLKAELGRFLSECDLDSTRTERAREIIGKYIDFMNANDLSKHWPAFLNYTTRLDEIRNQDFRLLRPLFNY